MNRGRILRGLNVLFAVVLLIAGVMPAGAATPAPGARQAAAPSSLRPLCDDNGVLCTETLDTYNYEGQYTGHDEPSLLFYSQVAGSGNSNLYRLTLPKDPPKMPTQNGTGGTFNFQLHPAFWFGMIMCDSQSAPEYTTNCTPDSDANIFDNPNPAAPDFMGHHPGGAFMEMQFYPPGWAPWPPGVSCDATKWCAALNIDSFNENQNTGQFNNASCLNLVGAEPVNFAFITMSGVSHAPADPVNATAATFTPNPATDLFMNSGDQLTVDMHDTPSGFQVVIHDLTSGQSGSMTASIANQFAQVNFDPSASNCTSTPYAFHPMYATSGEHTRLTWTAHAYNVAFSDEIGHFEFCNAIDGEGGNCTSPGVNDPTLDADDAGCFDSAFTTRIGITGCLATDEDFDGVPYQAVWPGTASTPGVDVTMHPRAILFSSPLFNPGSGSLQEYSRVAFETDLPRIEFATNPPCNRTTGAGCVNPPAGANFYPIFSTRNSDQGCVWQLGGPGIPGTTNTFGGNSAAEFGPLLSLTYPTVGGTVSRFNDFRQVLSSNPCLNQQGQ